jgi:F-type H+-transporting ATPase subunit a
LHLSPDQIVYWEHGFVKINATIVFTWIVMLFLIVGAKLITRKLSQEVNRSRWQNFLEMLVITIQSQISEVGLQKPKRYLPFLGTLFLFIVTANLGTIVPAFEPPTASLSTTVALAICVFVAVPIFGVSSQGIRGYLKSYIEPTVVMLPFNLISEVSRTLALAV